MRAKTETSLKELIYSDLYRIKERKVNFKDMVRTYFVPQGTTFPYIFWLRVVHYLKNKGFRIMVVIPYFIMRHYEYKYDVHVNTNISIGDGILIVHGGAVYLNCKSIGNNFTVYQGVTLGSRKYGDKYKDEIPVIDNNVTIYTGAVVCGNIHIGDDVRIGANAYVDKDVEDGKTFIGATGRLL